MEKSSSPFNRRKIGGYYEVEALKFLEGKGYLKKASNYFTRWGEIDLVMEDKATLVFVEVKQRVNRKYGEPEESVTPGKINHLIRASMAYLVEKGIQDKPIRYDVVTLGPSGLRHWIDAFQGDSSYYY